MSNWEQVKRKQAENIERLFNENPDDWFYKSVMAEPIEKRTGFAPRDGKCYRCGKDITEGENGITVESLGDYIILGCPHCHLSFCD